MTHTSGDGFSAMRANPRVMKPQKYEAANVTRNDVNVMPKSSPAYLVRSPMSIFKARRNIQDFLRPDLVGLRFPVASSPHVPEGLSVLGLLPASEDTSMNTSICCPT